MKQNLEKFIRYISRTYFSYWIIWGIDLVISVTSTCFTYWWIHYLTGTLLNGWGMIQTGALAAVATTIASYLFHTYRNTVRYSQLRCLWPLICSSLFKMAGQSETFVCLVRRNVDYHRIRYLPDVDGYHLRGLDRHDEQGEYAYSDLWNG